MPDTQCKLNRDHGEGKYSVAEFIKDKAKETPPLLAWADPGPTAVELTGGTGRRTGFQPLVQGIPDWPADIPLAEARLFWGNSALHVVAEESGGCRWASIEESDVGSGDTLRGEMKVVTVRDCKRFGLENKQDLDLCAVEYRQQGRLVAWRLITGGR